MEQKELWIIGGVLLFVFLFNQWGYTGQAHVTDPYLERNPGPPRLSVYDRYPIRQDVSMPDQRDVGYRSARESSSMSFPSSRILGRPCQVNGYEGHWQLGYANDVFCNIEE